MNGRFIWFHFEEQTTIFSELKPQDIFRLFYIATYCDYHNNILKFNNKKINKFKLKELMNLTDPLYYKWYNLMIRYKYLEQVENSFKLNEKVFNKGNLSKTTRGTTRIFIHMIRNLYENLDPGEHYKLGYILRMIPFTNSNNNFLLKDLINIDINDLEPLKITDIAESLGFNKKSSKRITNQLLSIRYNKKEPLIKLLSSSCLNNNIFIINPKLFFGGTIEQNKRILILFEKND